MYRRFVLAAVFAGLTSCVAVPPRINNGYIERRIEPTDKLLLEIGGQLYFESRRELAAYVTSAIYAAKLCESITDLHQIPSAEGNLKLVIEIDELRASDVEVQGLVIMTNRAKAKVRLIDPHSQQVFGEANIDTTRLQDLAKILVPPDRSKRAHLLFGKVITNFLRGVVPSGTY